MSMTMTSRAVTQRIIGCILATWLLAAGGCQHQAQPAAVLLPPPRNYLMHLPGIGGKLMIDSWMTGGLVDGGVDADVEIYDWTCGDAGINALHAYARNQAQAQVIADNLTAHFRKDPRTRIYLTAHSGGNGLAVWALEKLPPDVKIESILLLSPALSPQYDLSAALRHVRGKAYVFWSPHDSIILGTGTRLMGTIDGVRSDSAGLIGFTRPASADVAQYAKLVSIKYDSAWLRYGNIGDHIGPMMPAFARNVLAPLLGGRPLPAPQASATTRPLPTAAAGS